MTYTIEEVAQIIMDITREQCACDINGNDEWLPYYCEMSEKCPYTTGTECWEQYLKHYKEART